MPETVLLEVEEQMEKSIADPRDEHPHSHKSGFSSIAATLRLRADAQPMQRVAPTCATIER